jgi:hypothetical protein
MSANNRNNPCTTIRDCQATPTECPQTAQCSMCHALGSDGSQYKPHRQNHRLPDSAHWGMSSPCRAQCRQSLLVLMKSRSPEKIQQHEMHQHETSRQHVEECEGEDRLVQPLGVPTREEHSRKPPSHPWRDAQESHTHTLTKPLRGKKIRDVPLTLWLHSSPDGYGHHDCGPTKTMFVCQLVTPACKQKCKRSRIVVLMLWFWCC